MPTSVTARVTPSITVSGAFFQKDPAKTYMENVRAMMEAAAEQGAQLARERFLVGSESRALIRELDDRVADHVIGRVASRSGKRWTTAAVVQVYNEGLTAEEGRSLMAAASLVEQRTHAIADATRFLQDGAAPNLTAGLE